ncbi:MAG: YCF48-related protein [Bacteroidota bacterium]
MKKLLLGFLLLITSLSAEAQWVRLDLPPGTYRDIHFSTQKTGFLVGDAGMVLKTVDDGVTWQKIDVGIKSNFKSVHFPTAKVGYIAADSVVVKTIDGGETWNKVLVDSLKNCRRVLFLNESTGFIEQNLGMVLKTKDGGSTWNPVSFTYYGKTLSPFYGIELSFGTPATGYSFVKQMDVQGLFKTIDSGDTWEFIEPKTYNGLYGQIFESLWFVDENNGVWGGWYDSFIASTRDGSINWESTTQPHPAHLRLKDNSGVLRSGIYDIFFPSKRIGYAIANVQSANATGDEYGLLKSNDGGKNWTFIPIDSGLYWYPDSRYKVYFANDNTGYIINPLEVLKTTTGGEEPVSVQEPLLKNISPNISPNPFKNSARIELPENVLCTNCSVKIYDIAGNDVTGNFTFKNSEHTISIISTTASIGEYVFTIIENEKVLLTGKLLKEAE